MKIGNPVLVEIPSHSLQRFCSAFCSGNDSAGFIGWSSTQVLLQSSPIEFNKLQVLGIHNVRQIQKIIERRYISEETRVQFHFDAIDSQFLFPITTDEFASLAATVVEN